MNEKISVIMSVYNCEKTVSRAIESIINQTYENWVMIICDDGSTDKTYDIISDYKTKYPEKFVVLRNDTNKKLPYSLNRCLEHVVTNVIARMDGDDWSASTRLEKQLNYLKNNPSVHLVGTGVSVSDGNKKIGSIIRLKEPDIKSLPYQNPFSHATIMTYKKVYDRLGGYSLDPTAIRVEDVELWCRFFAAGFIGHNLQEELYCILEDKSAIKRRTILARINEAKIKSRGYKALGFSWLLCMKPYLGILKSFVPIWIYRIVHNHKLKKS